MSSTQPVVKSKLRLKGILKVTNDAASIASQIADLIKAWLGPNLQSAKGDIELILEICRKIEETCANTKSSTKFDKKLIAILVLRELFPGLTVAEEDAAGQAIDFLCLYKLVKVGTILSKLSKLACVFF